MRALRFVLSFLTFCMLTVLTQVGGLVFLVNILAYRLIDKSVYRHWVRVTTRVLSFMVVYLFCIFAIVPMLAKKFGRVPLPMVESNYVRPTNILTALLCRNYVQPELRQATFEVAHQMNAKYPGTKLNYLDAGFPFIDGFPLIPHLSHGDGKKLDLSFYYVDAATQQYTNKVPSWLGYGVCEEPRASEFDRPAVCEQEGFWQYSLISKCVSQRNKASYPFDARRTKDMINLYASNRAIGKILIEPHLKTRLKLRSNKVRLHGCNAVRHDDHLHVQLK